MNRIPGADRRPGVERAAARGHGRGRADHYADLAHAMYSDAPDRCSGAAATGRCLCPADRTEPGCGQDGLVDARRPYQQTEAHCFGNLIVDDWEGKVKRMAARRGPDRLHGREPRRRVRREPATPPM